MIRPRGPLAPLPGSEAVWDTAGRLRSQRYRDGYSGNDDTLGESQHVFLAGNKLEERFREASPERFVVAELGFGTGTNFLLTWQAFDRLAPSGRCLHYISIEAHPLRRDTLAAALAPFEALSEYAPSLIEAYPAPLSGVHRRSFDGGRITLDLYWAEAADAVAELARNARARVDAWYLDGFAPARNPAMWAPPVLRDVARSSRDGASLATFSAAGAVRRALDEAGFTVERRPGFGRKRESLCARLQTRPEREAPVETPWDRDGATRAVQHGQALVLGAGLAGCHAAAALARRGWQVRVLEAEGIAARASGNAQGLLFNRFSHQRSPLADFSLQAVEYAYQLYAGLFACGALNRGRDGDLTGCFQTAPPRGDFRAVQTALENLSELALTLRAREAGDRLGVDPKDEGLWQVRSGWLAPPAVCRALLDHPAIEVETGCGSLTLEVGAAGRDRNSAWIARDKNARERGSAPIVIIAAGSASRELPATAPLPLRLARGQTTIVPAPPGQALRACLCHRGYIAPAVDGYHAIGATFAPGDGDTALRVDDHQHNLNELAQALPEWRPYLSSLDATQLQGRAEARCVSPDYLPLIGPVPDAAAFRSCYGQLGRDARRVLPQPGPYLPGLYISTAHGSRGLSYAALGGEILASRICGEAPPLSTELLRALAPARFLIRAIVRGDVR